MKSDPYVRQLYGSPRQEQPSASKVLQTTQILDDDDGPRAQPSEDSAIADGKGAVTNPPYSGKALPPGWVPKWSVTKRKYFFANEEGKLKSTFVYDEVRTAPPPAQYIKEHSLPMAPQGWKWIWSSSKNTYYCFHSPGKRTFDHGEVCKILLDQREGIYTFWVHVGDPKLIARTHLRTNMYAQIVKIC